MYYVMIIIKDFPVTTECEWKDGFLDYDEAVEKADFLCENLLGIWSVGVYHFDGEEMVVDYERER